MLFLAQRGGDVSRCRDRISVSNTLKVCRRNERSRTYAQTKQPDTYPANVSNDVGFDLSLERSTTHVIVCGNQVEVRELQRRGQRINAIVEFVIAQCANIVSDGRHRLILDLAFIEIEVRSPLQDIARVDEQSVGILLSNSLD